jgi:tRNA modification GTPase
VYVTDTIVAPATPPGQGSVAIVRLSGPEAIAILHSIWRPHSKQKVKPRTLYLGEITDPSTGAVIDRALAVIMPAPSSLTGEDVVELQCHGGPFLVRRIVAIAMSKGARIAAPGEFSRRAFLNGRMDLTEAEAIADLISAQGEGAMRQAIDQLQGGLAQRVSGLRRLVISIRAHLEVEIDFSDEGLKLPSRSEIASEIERLRNDLALLHDSFARGRLMREGARATILGKPNVGKSSLLNLLLGVERAIVTSIPGTTRDVIEDSIQVGPYALLLQDTAGVRDSAELIENIGIQRALSHAGSADLLLTVFDSSQPLDADDRGVIALSLGRPCIALLNKSDLPPRLRPEDLAANGLTKPILKFSTVTAEGLSELRSELEVALDSIASGGANYSGVVISRERHKDALAKARDGLDAARASALDGMPPEIIAVDIAAAADALGAITGDITSEDVLDVVFRDFCIGK